MSEPCCRNILILIGTQSDQLDQICELLENRVSNLESVTNEKVDRQTLVFNSIWVAPNKLIKVISKQLPNITFLLEGRVEDKFITKSIHKDGKMIDVEEVMIGKETKFFEEL